METGPYLMLPLFGPSSFRGALGLTLDTFSDPLYYISRNKKRKHNHSRQQFYILESLYAINMLNTRHNKAEFIDDIKKTSPDPYITIRNFYFQKQAALKKRIRERQQKQRLGRPKRNKR